MRRRGGAAAVVAAVVAVAKEERRSTRGGALRHQPVGTGTRKSLARCYDVSRCVMARGCARDDGGVMRKKLGIFRKNECAEVVRANAFLEIRFVLWVRAGVRRGGCALVDRG